MRRNGVNDASISYTNHIYVFLLPAESPEIFFHTPRLKFLVKIQTATKMTRPRFSTKKTFEMSCHFEFTANNDEHWNYLKLHCCSCGACLSLWFPKPRYSTKSCYQLHLKLQSIRYIFVHRTSPGSVI